MHAKKKMLRDRKAVKNVFFPPCWYTDGDDQLLQKAFKMFFVLATAS